jgi:hypothetical protein
MKSGTRFDGEERNQSASDTGDIDAIEEAARQGEDAEVGQGVENEVNRAGFGLNATVLGNKASLSGDRKKCADTSGIGTASTSLGDLRPQSISTLARQSHFALPGAYRVFPFGLRRSEQMANNESEVLRVGPDAVVPATDHDVVLDATLADHVTLPCVVVLQQATQVDPLELDSSHILRRRAIAFILFAALACAVGISVGVVAGRNNNSKESFDAQAITFETFRDTRLPQESFHRSTGDPHSPQARALQWLDESLHGSAMPAWRVLQRYALAVVYYSLHGEGWLNSTGWLIDADECNWWSQKEQPCDINHRYISLTLADNNLTGSLPPEISLLTCLEIIDLPGNVISGAIPATIGSLSQLKRLSLLDNILTGSIPTEIGRLQQMTRLMLDRNQLAGRIPTEIGRLLQLNIFSMGKNVLTGPIPSEVGLLVKTASIYFDSNRLNGTLPILMANMINLIDLDLGTNFLSGTIPTEIAMLQHVELLVLDKNRIEGTIPTHVGLMPALRELYLQRTLISGSIPSEL